MYSLCEADINRGLATPPNLGHHTHQVHLRHSAEED